ncbi:hypothetical protein LAZ67_13003262 [Cordylochernes scorpioides]|uniref:CCHC-type domain-containing protein n=1 Tax=Cordylochernes scorpioides TaxID=51811 RepID=A0ABY6L562_9ARAC|nr:hypothetical protein LAZ67_13003262 [Cordylochernes scorpioides]
MLLMVFSEIVGIPEIPADGPCRSITAARAEIHKGAIIKRIRSTRHVRRRHINKTDFLKMAAEYQAEEAVEEAGVAAVVEEAVESVAEDKKKVHFHCVIPFFQERVAIGHVSDLEAVVWVLRCLEYRSSIYDYFLWIHSTLASDSLTMTVVCEHGSSDNDCCRVTGSEINISQMAPRQLLVNTAIPCRATSRNTKLGRPDSFVELTSICLGMSTFTFDTQFFKQTKGSPMGSPLSTVVAEVVMRSLDQWITSRHSSDIFLWRRYIDDTFCLVSEVSASHILSDLNSFHPDIAFTHETENHSIFPSCDCFRSLTSGTEDQRKYELRKTVLRYTWVEDHGHPMFPTNRLYMVDNVLARLRQKGDRAENIFILLIPSTHGTGHDNHVHVVQAMIIMYSHAVGDFPRRLIHSLVLSHRVSKVSSPLSQFENRGPRLEVEAQGHHVRAPHDPPHGRRLARHSGEATLDRSNVYRWYKMFSEGREDVNDEERAGRPSTSTTDEKINEVEKMILANRRITVREVAEDLNISIGSCHSIFINDFGMRRVAAKFVPKLLNCDQKQHRMNIANEMLDSVRDDPNLLQSVITGDEAWVYGYDVETKAQSSQWKLPHEPRPKKARQVRSNVKVLLTVFFDCRGVVHHEFLPQGRTVNKEYYLQVMRNLREAIRQKRPDLWKNKNWLLHHDNAPAHTSLLVRAILAKNNTLMMPQPPYSPDLAPCDFFLFPKLKRPMKGRRYASLDEIKTASKEELKKIFKNDLLKCFEDWKNRWHKCIISHGDYFEGDKIACTTLMRANSPKRALIIMSNPTRECKKKEAENVAKPLVSLAQLEKENEEAILPFQNPSSSSDPAYAFGLYAQMHKFIHLRTGQINALLAEVESLSGILASFKELDEDANKPQTACHSTQTSPPPCLKETSSQTDPTKPATHAATKRKQPEAPNPPAKRSNLKGPAKPAPSRPTKPAAAQVVLHGEKSAAHTVVISDDPQADPRAMLKAVRAAHTLPQGVWASLRTKGKLVLHSSNPDNIPAVTTSLANKLDGMKVRQQKVILPRICLFKVDEETSNSTIEETLLETPAVSQLPGDKVVRVAHRSAPRNGTCTAFIEVDLTTFSALGNRGRIVVDGVILNFEESIRARICFRCCGFGHNSAQCTRDPKCFHCGEGGHDGRSCPSAADRRTSKCANCCAQGLSDKHEARASSCPTLKLRALKF